LGVAATQLAAVTPALWLVGGQICDTTQLAVLWNSLEFSAIHNRAGSNFWRSSLPQKKPAAFNKRFFMRQIGTLDLATEAERFAAYLVTQGIDAFAEEEGGAWVIWVRDENHLEDARNELKQFRVDPQAPQYAGATRKAEQIERQKNKQAQTARRNVVDIRGTWGRGMPGRGGPPQRRPLTLLLIGVSVILFLIGGDKTQIYRSLEFADAAHFTGKVFEHEDGSVRVVEPELRDLSISNRLVDIKKGQVWRLITPIFLHFGIMHIFFNCYLLYYIGSQLENYYGTFWYGLLVLALALFSVPVQCLMPDNPLGLPIDGGSPFGGGLSGVVFGLFGFMWLKMRLQPAAGFFMTPFLIIIMFGQFILGITGVLETVFHMKNIGHWAHGGGLLAGIVIGFLHDSIRKLRR